MKSMVMVRVGGSYRDKVEIERLIWRICVCTQTVKVDFLVSFFFFFFFFCSGQDLVNVRGWILLFFSSFITYECIGEGMVQVYRFFLI
ncbi:hypothetical protein HanIR_Chr09g0441441 [Helianthus annuus]|nr:hypothetical protein HanIR_Chr09g0441441 [Helianthus annuus]